MFAVAACSSGGATQDGGTTQDAAADACDCASDPHNCGAIGHDCLGGACNVGVCQPVTIVSSVYFASAINVDGANVYWVQPPGPTPLAQGGVLSCPKSGCKTYSTLTTNQARGLRASATDLYWSGASGIETCAKSGCTPSTFSATGSNTLTVDGQNLVWTSGLEVLFCPLSGCSAPSTISSIPLTSFVATDTTSAYWVGFEDAGVDASPKSTLRSAPVVPNAISKLLATNLTAMETAIAVDDTNVYWSHPSGTISTCPKTDCSAPSVLASGQRPIAIIVDDTYVWWLNGLGPPPPPPAIPPSDGSIMKCKKTGCGGNATTVLANVGPSSITQDAVAIYWTDLASNGVGTVRMLAK